MAIHAASTSEVVSSLEEFVKEASGAVRKETFCNMERSVAKIRSLYEETQNDFKVCYKAQSQISRWKSLFYVLDKKEMIEKLDELEKSISAGYEERHPHYL